jgi:ABC-type phosphate/phosphonate transport system substrate-binding protein
MGRATFYFGIARTKPLIAGRFFELCAILSAKGDIDVVPVQMGSYSELADAIASKEVAIAWMPPIALIELLEQELVDVLALPLRSGNLGYHTALISKAGASNAIESYRGSSVAWVDVHSASGYLVARVHLASLGIDPRGFFGSEEFVKTHSSVVEKVAAGTADIGATFCSLDSDGNVVTAAWMDSTGTRPVQVVATAGPIPNDAIVVSSDLSAAERETFLHMFVSPNDRVKALLKDVFDTSEFRLGVPDHYASLRELVCAAREQGHESLVRIALAGDK